MEGKYTAAQSQTPVEALKADVKSSIVNDLKIIVPHVNEKIIEEKADQLVEFIEAALDKKYKRAREHKVGFTAVLKERDDPAFVWPDFFTEYWLLDEINAFVDSQKEGVALVPEPEYP